MRKPTGPDKLNKADPYNVVRNFFFKKHDEAVYKRTLKEKKLNFLERSERRRLNPLLLVVSRQKLQTPEAKEFEQKVMESEKEVEAGRIELETYGYYSH